MTIFEPIFLLLAITTIGAAITTAIAAIRGNAPRARRIVRRVAIGTACYFSVAIVASAFVPRREYQVGDAQCYDDWCITVTHAGRGPAPADTAYDIALSFSNRARRVPMGEKGTVMYLEDAADNRINPVSRPDDVPIDTIIPPGGAIGATRRFIVPRAARLSGLVYTHEGGFPIWWLIIGADGGWFAKPPIVRLP